MSIKFQDPTYRATFRAATPAKRNAMMHEDGGFLPHPDGVPNQWVSASLHCKLTAGARAARPSVAVSDFDALVAQGEKDGKLTATNKATFLAIVGGDSRKLGILLANIGAEITPAPTPAPSPRPAPFPPPPPAVPAISARELATCKARGWDPKDYAAQAGLAVPTTITTAAGPTLSPRELATCKARGWDAAQYAANFGLTAPAARGQRATISDRERQACENRGWDVNDYAANASNVDGAVA